MAEFAESLNSLKASFPFLEMDQGLELMGQFGELGCNVMENPSMGLMGFSSGSCLSQQPDFAPFMDGLLGLLPAECPKPITGSQPAGSTAGMSHGDRKKMKAMAAPETSSGKSSGSPSESMVRGDKTKKRNSPGSGKRGRSKAKEAERPNEVVHVRARRGQATDSHSLAERVRREKINERMRCLQDLVPGCYKTMGMAGTLDEIINYVQSLQNQVEFLSLKLSAASSFYDFSMDDEAAAAPQVGDVYEVQEMERLVREGYGVCTSFHSTVPL